MRQPRPRSLRQARVLSPTALLLFALALPTYALSKEPGMVSVPELDLHQYAGTWFEIARLPNFFERKCASAVTAEYTLLPDESITVINSCTTQDGKRISAEGQARTTSEPGQLKVAFAPRFLRWLPFVWGDYWVIRNEAYGLVVVSEPGREYLWILSREQQPDPARIEKILTWLEAEGFNSAELIFVLPNQDPGLTP